MTVIAYSSRHRVMAADSQCSSEDLSRFASVQKVFRLRTGALFGSAGEIDTRDLRALLERATPRKLPTRKQLVELEADVEALLVFPAGHIFCITIEFHEGDSEGRWIASVMPVRDQVVAIGSGAAYAYGAMECRASPTDAVRAACRRDLGCSLPVQWEGLTP